MYGKQLPNCESVEEIKKRNTKWPGVNIGANIFKLFNRSTDNKTIYLEINGQTKRVNIDKLKLAFLLDESSTMSLLL